jgi:hypothetical protein
MPALLKIKTPPKNTAMEVNSFGDTFPTACN